MDRSSSFCSAIPLPNFQNLEVGSTSSLSVQGVGLAGVLSASEEGLVGVFSV